MKKPILSKYMQIDMFVMEEEKANEFDQLFETLLVLLKLKHNLTPEIMIEKHCALVLYSRNSEGISDFSLRLDATFNNSNGTVVTTDFEILIISEEIDLSSIDMFNLDFNWDRYSFKSKYNEDVLLNIMCELVKCI
jgi:hypothetical protein